MRQSDTVSSRSFPSGHGPRFLLAYVALFIPFAVATPYFQRLLSMRGFDHYAIGVILGWFEFMAVVAPPIWGLLSDWSRKPRLVLALAIAGVAPSFLLFGTTSALLPAIGAAILFGFFYRPLVPLTDGVTFRCIHARGGDYGRIRIGGSIGFLVAVLMLEQLGIAKDTTGRMILLAMMVATGVHLFSVLIIPHPPADTSRTDKVERKPRNFAALATRPLIMLTLCGFLGRIAMTSYYSFFTLYLQDVHQFRQAGYLWVLGPLSELPLIFFSRRIMDRIGVRSLFALGLVGIAMRLTGLGLASTIWLVIPLQLLHCLTFGAFHTASVTYVSYSVPARLQSSAQTLFAGLTAGGGALVGGFLGGWVCRAWGFRPLYLSFSLFAVVALVVLFLFVPELPAQEETA